MRYNVQVRRGPEGSVVEYTARLSLADARQIALTVPRGGLAGIWDENRLIRAWYSRPVDKVVIADMEAARRERP